MRALTVFLFGYFRVINSKMIKVHPVLSGYYLLVVGYPGGM